MSRLLFVVAVSCFIVCCGFPSQTNAALKWYTATVNQAGPSYESSHYEMRFLMDFGSSVKWMKAYPGREKEMLAVALSAISNGKRVKIYADFAVPANTTPMIKSIYILAEP